MRTSFAGLALLALLGAASGSESNTNVPRAPKHYVLPATPANVQWGWYDPAEKPKLVINSGDTEAYALTSMVGDCRVTQVVDIRQGVHCMIPKHVFVGHQ